MLAPADTRRAPATGSVVAAAGERRRRLLTRCAKWTAHASANRRASASGSASSGASAGAPSVSGRSASLPPPCCAKCG